MTQGFVDTSPEENMLDMEPHYRWWKPWESKRTLTAIYKLLFCAEIHMRAQTHTQSHTHKHTHRSTHSFIYIYICVRVCARARGVCVCVFVCYTIVHDDELAYMSK